jgi:AraC-like DNA-binding protein
VGRARARLGEDLKRPCRPRQVARELGCDYERFRKLFQRDTGLSPIRWHMRRRMDRACELLLNRKLTIAHVAEAVGFSDQALFATRFRRHCGMSPSQFRRGLSPQ